MKTSYNIIDHYYDVIVIGAGGSGLRATLGCAEAGLKYFLLEAILLLHKVVLALRLEIWERIIGNGICMIQ